MKIFKVKVSKLAELLKPFSTMPSLWGKKPITKFEVDEALFSIDLLSPDNKTKTRQDHVRIIAHYAAHGFGNSIKLRMETSTSIIVEEGHHRLRAAIHRGDEFIFATVNGSEDLIAGYLK